jgi:hypothetical protein
VRNEPDIVVVGLPRADAMQRAHEVLLRAIAERPLATPLVGIHLALEHDMRARRHLESDGSAPDQLDAPPGQKAAELQLVEALGLTASSRFSFVLPRLREMSTSKNSNVRSFVRPL